MKNKILRDYLISKTKILHEINSKQKAICNQNIKGIITQGYRIRLKRKNCKNCLKVTQKTAL